MDTRSFFEWDFQASLFPLRTNLLLIQNHHQAIEQYIGRILSDAPAHVGDNFLPQTRVYAAKPKHHLRRTVVLDPVASYFLYDLVLRNKDAFGHAGTPTRKVFGYKFEHDHPVPVHTAYKSFTDEIDVNHLLNYSHMISFDIASYFNSIYHHDATNWFASLAGVSGVDVNAFGRFFREINAGRSIDFLPQGIYPSKMIGSEFLRFIELSGQLKCAETLRFMDDIYLFDDDAHVLIQDFLRIQELLGLRALNVNPTKTMIDGNDPTISLEASVIQKELASLIEGYNVSASYSYGGSGADSSFDDLFEPSADESEKVALSQKQIDRLLELLTDSKADEADVEEILRILHDYSDSVVTHIPYLLARFPNIVKQLHKLAGAIGDKESLAKELLEVLEKNPALLEYQLFWMTVIAEDHLGGTKAFGKLVMKLYERTSVSKVARAKVLEIPDQSFGLKEIRDEILKSGASDWHSWAAAIGTRTLNKAERNYVLKYFSKGSPLNYLVAECVQKL